MRTHGRLNYLCRVAVSWELTPRARPRAVSRSNTKGLGDARQIKETSKTSIVPVTLLCPHDLCPHDPNQDTLNAAVACSWVSYTPRIRIPTIGCTSTRP